MKVGDILAKGPPYPGRTYDLRLPKPPEQRRDLPIWVREKIARERTKPKVKDNQPTLF